MHSHLKLNKVNTSFIAHSINKYPFCGLFSYVSSHFYWWFHCLSTLRHSAEVPPNVLKYNEAMVSLPKKICMLDKLCPGMSYSAWPGVQC